jgi:hypothetical protein
MRECTAKDAARWRPSGVSAYASWLDAFSYLCNLFVMQIEYFRKITDIPTPVTSVPVLRNKRFIGSSLLLISRQISSTVRIKLVSALMKIYSPLAFNALHSTAIRSPASWERPTKVDTGLAGMLSELLQRGFANAISCIDKDSDETRRKG